MKNQKALTNKGFSLVELIIVVAIMAVLIGVLAPQYLRYVERTRLQRDNTSMGELANVIKMAGAEESVIQQINAAGATGLVISFDTDGKVDTSSSALATGGTGASSGALAQEIGATMDLSDINLSSSTYAGNMPTITIKLNTTTNQIEVTASVWKDKPTDANFQNDKKF